MIGFIEALLNGVLMGSIYGLTAVGHEHHFVLFRYQCDADDGAVAIAGVDQDDALPAAVLLTVLVDGGSLAVAALANG